MDAIDDANITMFDNIPVLSAIAGALTRINSDADRVEKIFKRIIELESTNLNAHGQLAIHYHKRNKTKLAIKYYKKARTINPTFRVRDERFAEFIKMWIIAEQLKRNSVVATNVTTEFQSDNQTKAT